MLTVINDCPLFIPGLNGKAPWIGLTDSQSSQHRDFLRFLLQEMRSSWLRQP